MIDDKGYRETDAFLYEAEREEGSMYEGCRADIRMNRMILKEGRFDEKVHRCNIITYKPEEECIYLVAEDTEVTEFSLDGNYECRIHTEKGNTVCIGSILERYWNKAGRVLKFQIKNGFYKNLVN